MINGKVMGLLKYRFYNLPIETVWGYGIVVAIALIAAFLGLPVVSAGIVMWLLPTVVSWNGLEQTERTITKLQLSMPISRKENVNIRFMSYLVVNVIAIGIGFLLYSLTDFFVSLNVGAVINLDVGGLNWLFAQISFLTIVKVTVGYTLYNAALYYGLSYTIFKNQGKPPVLVTLLITAAFLMADSYMHWFNLTWDSMPTVMFVLGGGMFIISYFVSVKAFRKIDFS